MHIEILVEDASGQKMLEILVPKIIGEYGKPHTWRIKGYKGIGHIPKGLKNRTDPKKRLLLDQLPRILMGYSKTDGIDAVVVVVDADNRDCKDFLRELERTSREASKRLTIMFRLAIEEIEAWYLGDKTALLRAYSQGNSKQTMLRRYQQDSICQTWETLADIIYQGGCRAMKKSNNIGSIKCEWADKITPLMNPEINVSPSFQKFRDGLRRLTSKS